MIIVIISLIQHVATDSSKTFLKNCNVKDFLYNFYKNLDSIFKETKLKEINE